MRTRSHPKELRCKSCGILLAKIDDSGLNIRRGQLQATLHGDFHASIVCYRTSCRTLNVLKLCTTVSKGGAVS
jgi:hypothetical protein